MCNRNLSFAIALLFNDKKIVFYLSYFTKNKQKTLNQKIMYECNLTDEERKSFHNLQIQAAKMRVKKIKAEEEFIKYVGEDLSREECIEIEKKRRKILHELEVEGADIELEYVAKYRNKLSGFQIGGIGGLHAFGTCIICEKCITSTCLDCTACSSCVTISSI